MILTSCAACAAPLTHKAPQCGRCQTRYCGRPCQELHWKKGGHKAMCKKVKKGGGAEQYHAEQKYAEAVAVAVEACAEDTKGQTCYICTEALHWKTKEGLVRGCACHTTEGFVHVSCLREQAKILNDEAEENNSGVKVRNATWARWYSCGLCEKWYHGVVACALGWACWKTYVGRPEEDGARRSAMEVLADAFSRNGDDKMALMIYEARYDTERRLCASNFKERSNDDDMIDLQSYIASCCYNLGRHEEALIARRTVYEQRLAKYGPMHEDTIYAASGLAHSLVEDYWFAEAKRFLRDKISNAQSVLGNRHRTTIILRLLYAQAVYIDDGSSFDEVQEAVATLEDDCRTARQVFGKDHPDHLQSRRVLNQARKRLAYEEARLNSVDSTSEKLNRSLRIDGDDESEAP